MRIIELYSDRAPVFSFEFFPPRTDTGYASLFRTISDLKKLGPGFVSVTWGAGGSTQRRTVDLVTRIQSEIGLTAMAHLTCVGSPLENLSETLDRLDAAGIANVLALSGDEPEHYEPPGDSLRYANELVDHIRRRWQFCVAGACYPETHPRAPSREVDLANLARKVRSGVDFLITQLFFDNRDYFRLVAEARERGIGVPIVPGIMPIVSSSSIRRMAALCGARIPDELAARLAAAAEDDRQTLEVGVSWATRQCRELLEAGAPGIHFYTLNRSPATRMVHERLR